MRGPATIETVRKPAASKRSARVTSLGCGPGANQASTVVGAAPGSPWSSRAEARGQFVGAWAAGKARRGPGRHSPRGSSSGDSPPTVISSTDPVAGSGEQAAIDGTRSSASRAARGLGGCTPRGLGRCGEVTRGLEPGRAHSFQPCGPSAPWPHPCPPLQGSRNSRSPWRPHGPLGTKGHFRTKTRRRRTPRLPQFELLIPAPETRMPRRNSPHDWCFGRNAPFRSAQGASPRNGTLRHRLDKGNSIFGISHPETFPHTGAHLRLPSCRAGGSRCLPL